MAPETLKADLAEFVDYRKKLDGDEKGEAQVFLDRLFRAFGLIGVKEAGATLEARVRTPNEKKVSFADLMWKPRCIIEMKKGGTDLSKHFAQAFKYWQLAVPDRPRYVVLCNFDEFWVYDFDKQIEAPMDVLKSATSLNVVMCSHSSSRWKRSQFSATTWFKSHVKPRLRCRAFSAQ